MTESKTTTKKAAPKGRNRVGIVRALLAATKEMESITKGSRNEFHSFNFTGCEQMLAETGPVLARHGLGLFPRSTTHHQVGDWTILRREMDLVHESGEREDGLIIEVPVCPGKGRPEDKASLGSASTSLSYLIRDLLRIPRIESEVCGRDDTRHEPKPYDRGAALAELVEYARGTDDGGIEWLDRVLGHYGVDKIVSLTDENVREAVAAVRKKKGGS